MHEPHAARSALLLTGGDSQRMGRDKAGIEIGGEPAAARIAGLIEALELPACEVGLGWTDLPVVVEEPVGAGPLAAVAAGWVWLQGAGHHGPVLVLSCDTPLLDLDAVEWLAQHPAAGAVFPLVDDRPQWLCGRWDPALLDHATRLAAAGERAVHRALDDQPATRVPEDEWTAALSPKVFADANTPESLGRLLGKTHTTPGEFWDGRRSDRHGS